MDSSLIQAIERAASGQVVSDSTWRQISDVLLDGLHELIGTDFERDEEVSVNEGTAFSRSFWSQHDSNELSLEWRGVVGGEPVGDDSFAISASVFLFHARSRKRLVTSDGESFLEFSYEMPTESGGGGWTAHGWLEDIYGEWENLRYLGENS